MTLVFHSDKKKTKKKQCINNEAEKKLTEIK